METILRIAARSIRRTAEEFDANLKQLKQQLGVDLRKDVLESLDDVWCAYNSSDEGGLILTGLTAVVRVKDYDRLSAAQAKLLAAAKAALRTGRRAGDDDRKGGSHEPSRIGPRGRRPKSRNERRKRRWPATARTLPVRGRGSSNCTSRGRTSTSSRPDDLPFAPAWCLTPQGTDRGRLSAADQGVSVAAGPISSRWPRRPKWPTRLKAGEAPVALCVLRRRKLLDYLYPLALHGHADGQPGIGPGRDRPERVDHSLGPRDLQAPAAQRHRGAADGRPASRSISRGTVPGSSLVLVARCGSACCCPRSHRPAQRAAAHNR